MKLKHPVMVLPVVIVAVLAVCFGIWTVLYPGPADDKCPRYVLWKLGVLPYAPNVVLPSMVGDTRRERLVVDLTLTQLEHRFGRLLTRAEATVSYQRFYSDRYFLDQDIRWIGDSPWLIIFENGRAKELRLMKG